jgi:hypothetical protein
MSDSWQIPFRTLRDQFLDASRAEWKLELNLTSFPNWDAHQRWFRERVKGSLSFAAEHKCDQKSTGMVWGDAPGVDRYAALATAAGQCLPVEFAPPARLFPFWNELSNRNPPPDAVWAEFLYVAQFSHFVVEENWPVPESRIARLQGDPFLVSALAIDYFILTPSAKSVSEFHSQMRSVCPWITFEDGGAASVPAPLSSLPPTHEQALSADEKVRGYIAEHGEFSFDKAKLWLDEAARATGLSKYQLAKNPVWQEHENETVRTWLEKRRGATGKDVEAVFGFNPAKKPTLKQIWDAHVARKSEGKQLREPRQLADGEVDDRPDNRTALSQAAEARDEILEAVKQLDPGVRKKILALPTQGQADLIAFLLEKCEPEEMATKPEQERNAILVEVTKAWLEEYEQQCRRAKQPRQHHSE